MIGEEKLCEFKDCIDEICNRYDEVKDYIKTKTDIINEDIKYIDGIIEELKDYKEYSLNGYLGIISNLSRSLCYFQKDTGLNYNITLIQLITYVNTFYNSCMCEFKPVFSKSNTR